MKIHVKPTKPDVKVRKPDGKHLAEQGEEVTKSAFWVRRINDGDVEIVSDADTPKETTQSTTKAAPAKVADKKGA